MRDAAFSVTSADRSRSQSTSAQFTKKNVKEPKNVFIVISKLILGLVSSFKACTTGILGKVGKTTKSHFPGSVDAEQNKATISQVMT